MEAGGGQVFATVEADYRVRLEANTVLHRFCGEASAPADAWPGETLLVERRGEHASS